MVKHHRIKFLTYRFDQSLIFLLILKCGHRSFLWYRGDTVDSLGLSRGYSIENIIVSKLSSTISSDNSCYLRLPILSSYDC